MANGGGGGGGGGAYSGKDAFLENGRLFEEILYIETLHWKINSRQWDRVKEGKCPFVDLKL